MFEIEDARYESYKECIFGFDNMDIEDGGVTNSDGASVECKSIIIDDNDVNQKLFDKNAREKIEELLVNANYCNFVNSVCFLAHFIPKELYPNYFKLLLQEIDFDKKTRILLVYSVVKEHKKLIKKMDEFLEEAHEEFRAFLHESLYYWKRKENVSECIDKVIDNYLEFFTFKEYSFFMQSYLQIGNDIIKSISNNDIKIEYNPNNLLKGSIDILCVEKDGVIIKYNTFIHYIESKDEKVIKRILKEHYKEKLDEQEKVIKENINNVNKIIDNVFFINLDNLEPKIIYISDLNDLHTK